MGSYGQVSIGIEHKVAGVLTDASAVVLTDISGIYGIRERDAKIVLVAASTVVSGVSTGIYTYDNNGAGIFALPTYSPTKAYEYSFRILQTTGSVITLPGDFPAATPGTVTLEDVFNRVNFFLKKENKFWTSGEIITFIGEDAFRRIAEDIDYPKANYSSYLASGEWKVTVPGDFIKIDQHKNVVYNDGSDTIQLSPKKQTSIGRDEILTAVPGTPENYFMETESTIGIYPPSISGVIVIPYVKVPSTLSAATDTNELTDNCYQAAVYWTVWQCMLKDSDPRAVNYENLYNGETFRLRKRYGEMYEEESNLEPHHDYVK
jgi:hypothetical protein